MGFLSRLFGGGTAASAGQDNGDRDGLHFYVRCDKCGETIHIRASKANDVGVDYGDDDAVSRALHKEVLGSRCQNLMYVHLTLDDRFNIVESSTERCTLISREQYEASQASA